MFKFIYEGSTTKTTHEIVDTCPNIHDMLDHFRDFLLGAGFEFSEQIVLDEEFEEGICTIDEIAEENEFLKAQVEELQNKLSRASVTRVAVITREGREYETWLDDTSEFMLEYQDGGRTLKLFEIDRDDRDFLV